MFIFGCVSLVLVVVAAAVIWRNGNRDLAYSSLFSWTLIFLILQGSEWLKSKPKPPAKEAPSIEVKMEMPKLEPEEPDVVDDTQQQTNPVDLAPPMQTDVPQVATDTSFVQQVEPPPPDVNINKNALRVPQNTGKWKNGMQVFDISMLDQKPQPTFQPNPNYPFEMRRAGITGSVTVDFIVDTGGNVINAYAVSSTQHEFEANAVQGVSRWKFKPGKRGGRVVATHMQVPIQFTLNNDQ